MASPVFHTRLYYFLRIAKTSAAIESNVAIPDKILLTTH